MRPKSAWDKPFFIADLPAQPIDKCIAGPGLLTQIIIEKYCDHLPRQGFYSLGHNYRASYRKLL